ncbi:MAG: LEA type 2 family protein [Spirochaetia bacterium]|nr:LEA type 2 family protein [Spirochaetia bacterium]
MNKLDGTLGKIADKIPKPTATIEKFDIKKISLRDITFTFDIGINNPYPVAVNLDAVELDFSIEKNKLFHTSTSKGFKVDAKGKAVNSFDITLTYESIIQLIKDYNSHEYLLCDVDVSVFIPIPKTIKAIPETVKLAFKLDQQIPAIKPKITIAKFTVIPPSQKEIEDAIKKSTVETVKKADPQKVRNMYISLIQGKPAQNQVVNPDDLDLKFKVNFDIILENLAKAPLKFNTMQFDFLVNSDLLVNGNSTALQGSDNKTVLRVVNEFSSKNLSKQVLSAFKDGKGNFTVKGNTSLDLPPSIIKHPLLLNFKEDGNFNLR